MIELSQVFLRQVGSRLLTIPRDDVHIFLLDPLVTGWFPHISD